MDNIKIGVVGIGHLGSIHTKLWKSNANCTLSGIYDLDKERNLKISEEFSCIPFDSIEELISNSNAVTIAVPTSNHFEVAIKCIKSGIHCFIEKPVTSTYNEALELIELSKKHEVVLQVGHVERFNPALASLENYELNPRFIEAHRLSQFKPRAIDVSVIHDLMIHDIDIMLWLIKSKVSKIDANGVGILTDNPDIANARITFENGAVANLTASRISARPMRKMRIFQKNSYFSIDLGNQNVEVFRIVSDSDQNDSTALATMLGSIDQGLTNKKIIYEKPVISEKNAIAEEQKSFIDSIIKNAPVAVSVEEAAEALRIAELINNQITEFI